MLVLSRGTSDRISFPSLGISIEVLKLAGNRARIGIDAPKQIRVVRDELLSESDTQELELSRSRIAATSDAMRKFIGLEDERDRALGLFYVGHPGGDWPTSERGPVDDKVQWLDE